jgi:hypothetical protein
MTPRPRAALTAWFIRGAMAATRCADMPQVWVSHMSQMTMAVRATGQSRVCSVGAPFLERRRARRRRVPGTLGRLGRRGVL